MKKTFLILTAAFALASCKKENNNGNPAPQETRFGYNKTGHRWVYDFVYNGQVVDSLVNEITADSNGMYTMVSKRPGAGTNQLPVCWRRLPEKLRKRPG